MPESTAPLRNIPEFSVTSLSHTLKRTLEDTFARVRVRGEFSGVKFHSSGHMYANLKDEDSLINVVCWKGTVSRLAVRPEEGLEVICTGKITTFPARSNYQLVIDSIELAGQGALLKMLEERKKKLSAEGLFAAERKRIIPFLPDRIGVITSPTGAVIRDILHRLSDRFPRPVQLWPVAVQGEGAEIQITRAIEGFNALPVDQRPDVLIVARGGGSLEDLMAFNAESVVRAAAASAIPLISAVGHETDTTLIDYAADLRAPTPTAAAEMAVPERDVLRATVTDGALRLDKALGRILQNHGQAIALLTAKLGSPENLINLKQQKLDYAADRLSAQFIRTLDTREKKLAAHHIRPPQTVVREKAALLDRWTQALADTTARLLLGKEQILEKHQKMLDLLSFENVLARGYAVVRGPEGHPIQSPDGLTPGDVLDIQFAQQKKVSVSVT